MSRPKISGAKQAPLAAQFRDTPNLNPLPEAGYVRLAQLVGNPDARPPIPPIIPVGKSSIWSWVKTGQFPAPVKLGPRVTAWDARCIREFLDERAVAGAEKAAA